MNFNAFVIGSTFILFIILRIHKKKVENGDRLPMIYLLYTPMILYATKYYFKCGNVINTLKDIPQRALSSKASSSISSIYPLSS